MFYLQSFYAYINSNKCKINISSKLIFNELRLLGHFYIKNLCKRIVFFKNMYYNRQYRNL